MVRENKRDSRRGERSISGVVCRKGGSKVAGYISLVRELGLDTKTVVKLRTLYYKDYAAGFAARLSEEVLGEPPGLPPENTVRRRAWERGYIVCLMTLLGGKTLSHIWRGTWTPTVPFDGKSGRTSNRAIDTSITLSIKEASSFCGATCTPSCLTHSTLLRDGRYPIGRRATEEGAMGSIRFCSAHMHA